MYGANSTATSILAAIMPSTPSAPVTSFSPDSVTIKWTAPASNGAAITAYIIQVRISDLTTFTTDLNNCNGTSASVVAALSCTIPVTVL